MSLSNPFSDNSSSVSPQTSADTKSAIISQVQQESALNNARSLIGKVNENCFEKCVPSPGSSLSSKEQMCLTACMEKYIQLWNATSRAYGARVNQEHKAGFAGSSPLGGSGVYACAPVGREGGMDGGWHVFRLMLELELDLGLERTGLGWAGSNWMRTDEGHGMSLPKWALPGRLAIPLHDGGRLLRWHLLIGEHEKAGNQRCLWAATTSKYLVFGLINCDVTDIDVSTPPHRIYGLGGL
ncbi:mitochondrial import inner membrane translocase subunit TIM13 [Histoplasma capsulatum H143]|uniref:Mitochondrial import inner membrane translocase subunit TIM13 n=1 Tax=Ajellomyces capsulatus (strain H143) TaxID=544712 RepID=C6HK41_AJECH|nr:mitochondrial import inner membrane translocase subunit TIM13 [Histoplasma capsulatum H143]